VKDSVGGVNGGTSGSAPGSDQLLGDIQSIRGHLDELVGELSRRGHQALDLRRQLRRHPLGFVLGAIALCGLVGGAVAVSLARRRRARAVPPLSRLRRGLARRLDDGEPRGRRNRRDLGHRMLVSAGEAAAALVVKQLGQRALRPLRSPRRSSSPSQRRPLVLPQP
jgi:hypothetical protein